MGAGDLNDILMLAITASGIVFTWWRWGRKWVSGMRARAEERARARERMAKMVNDWHPTIESINTHMAVVRTYMADGDHVRSKIAADLERTSTKLSADIAANTARLYQRLDGQDDALAGLADVQDKIAAELWASARFDVQARFRCDHEGRNVFTNYSYSQLLRCDEKHLHGNGWKNYIVPEDLADYERDATEALRDHRRFERNVRFRRGDGTKFLGHVRCEPHPENFDDVAVGRYATWFGSVTPLEELS